MDVTFHYDEKIAGVELILKGDLIGNQPIKVTLSGHKAYDYTGSPAWWEYTWYFLFCYNKQNYILLYNSCTQGNGWFLEETYGTDLNTTVSIMLHDVRDRTHGKWSCVDLLADQAAIDDIVGARPRHCRGY